MTPEQLERAKDHACEKGTFDCLYDEGNTYWEDEWGVSFKAWVHVPKEVYENAEAGTAVVPGG